MIIDDHQKQQETVPRAFLGNWNPRESLANQMSSKSRPWGFHLTLDT